MKTSINQKCVIYMDCCSK